MVVHGLRSFCVLIIQFSLDLLCICEVASHQLCNDPAQASARGKVWYIHGAAEATGLEDGTADLISISLVAHELPESAARYVYPPPQSVLSWRFTVPATIVHNKAV